MPGTIDILFACVFAVLWPMWSYFVDWPRHVRAVAARDMKARTRFFRQTFLEQWALAAVAIALTVMAARSVSTLGLVAPTGWRLWVGIAAPLAYALLALPQLRAVSRAPRASLDKLRGKLAPLAPMLPHTEGEHRWFVLLSLTAGICEELLFRGYLVWLLTTWLGLWGAAATSAVVFGLAHMYQGGKFGTKAFVAGFVMQGLALACGSILPGMVLHALVDVVGGTVSYMVMRDPPVAEGGGANPAARTA